MLAETLRRPLSFAGRLLAGLGTLLVATICHLFFLLIFNVFFKAFFALQTRSVASRSDRPTNPTLPTTETAEPLLAVRR